MTALESARTAAPKKPSINECCQHAKNLWRERTDPFFAQDRCLICGKRHYRAIMAGLEIGISKR